MGKMLQFLDLLYLAAHLQIFNMRCLGSSPCHAYALPLTYYGSSNSLLDMGDQNSTQYSKHIRTKV